MTVQLDAAEERILMRMGRDDYYRAIRSMPRESQKKWLASTVKDMGEIAQGIDETLFEAILDLMQEQHQEDPFALLQDGDPHADEGQLMIKSMAPNLEMSFCGCAGNGFHAHYGSALSLERDHSRPQHSNDQECQSLGAFG